MNKGLLFHTLVLLESVLLPDLPPHHHHRHTYWVFFLPLTSHHGTCVPFKAHRHEKRSVINCPFFPELVSWSLTQASLITGVQKFITKNKIKREYANGPFCLPQSPVSFYGLDFFWHPNTGFSFETSNGDWMGVTKAQESSWGGKNLSKGWKFFAFRPHLQGLGPSV